MRRALSIILILIAMLPVSALTDPEGNEYKTSEVVLSLLDSEYIDIEIGFKDLEGGELTSIDVLPVGSGDAESEPFLVYWEIVCSDSFDLYLRGDKSFSLGGQALNWTVMTAPEDGSTGYSYWSDGKYENGGILHNFDGSDFRDSGERRIKIVTEDFSSLVSGEAEAELRVEIVSS